LKSGQNRRERGSSNTGRCTPRELDLFSALLKKKKGTRGFSSGQEGGAKEGVAK